MVFAKKKKKKKRCCKIIFGFGAFYKKKPGCCVRSSKPEAHDQRDPWTFPTKAFNSSFFFLCIIILLTLYKRIQTGSRETIIGKYVQNEHVGFMIIYYYYFFFDHPQPTLKRLCCSCDAPFLRSNKKKKNKKKKKKESNRCGDWREKKILVTKMKLLTACVLLSVFGETHTHTQWHTAFLYPLVLLFTTALGYIYFTTHNAHMYTPEREVSFNTCSSLPLSVSNYSTFSSAPLYLGVIAVIRNNKHKTTII